MINITQPSIIELGDVAIINHISYYNQGGVRTYGGQIETINPNNRASQVKGGNRIRDPECLVKCLKELNSHMRDSDKT